MVPADSRRISRVLRYSGAVSPVLPFSPTGLSPAPARLSRTVRLTFTLNLLTVLQPRVLRCHNRGLGSSAFDRLYLRNHFCFLLLLLLRCFSSQGSLSGICRNTPCGVGCPIRKSANQRVFAPRRGFSQLITSFFASESQGILYVPLSPFFNEILTTGLYSPDRGFCICCS